MKINKVIDKSNAFIKCVKVFKQRRNNSSVCTFSAIIEIEHEKYLEVLKREKINIGWDQCGVYDGLNVKRCFKCLGYNHNANTCTKKLRCGLCLGEHKSDECSTQVTNPVCGNCADANKDLGFKLDTGHSIFSKECPVYQRKLKIQKQRVGY
ncbi:PREDICTED: uncharacterized protein LOC108366523 isoform X1 [Rhagoletis zephyria]|uniref:uncharacterized protein LOC108366523 isoform X1 n=1 Tax=Rhagoletis zephyria TaxID=28612 RepID=UPI00081120BE|nr:PREDICTED: uncharacterized protein LOC108366523 isoform X1 [Rhagoletis zephyria]